MCENFFFPLWICVCGWGGGCCLIPLKEINERTTNRERGNRWRDEREKAAREGAEGLEGCSIGRWGCVCAIIYVCAALEVLCEVHSCPSEWNSFSLTLPVWFPVFFFLWGGGSSFKISHSLADVPFFHHLVILSVSPSFSLLCFLSFSRTTFLLSCLSWPYVCDVMQDKGAKLGWDVKLWESDGQRERVGKS